MQSVVFLTKSVEPLDSGFMAKPCQLAFGVVAHVQLGLFDGTRKVALAHQILNNTPVTMGAERIRTGREALVEKVLHFGHKPSLEMRFGAFVDTPVEFGSRRVESQNA